MRKLIALLTIFSIQNAYCVAPSGVGGEQGTLNYTNNIKAPNYQVTSLGGVNSRMETGNTNLLANPSFEHPTVGTGWTATNATPSAETSIVVEGKKSLKLVLTGALTAYQDSTINAAQLVGLQGVAAIKVKNSGVTDLKACARNAGVTSATLCVNIPNDNGWRHISIPFIMTATSNGIALTSTGTSGTVYVDDGFVGTSAPFQNVNSESVFSAKVSSAGVVTDESGDFINGNCSVSTATFTCTFVSSFFTVAPNCIADTSNTGTTTNISAGTSATASAATTQTNNAGIASAQPFTLYCQKQGKDMPLASKIYSQASQDTGWVPCAFSTLAWQGLGTVTNNLFCSRKGANLEMRGTVTLGTVAASLAQFPLPNNWGSITTGSTSSAESYGMILRNVASNNILTNAISTIGLGYFQVSDHLTIGSVNPATAVNGNVPFTSSNVLEFVNIKIPIQGWQDYGVIVGSFAGIEKCANDLECVEEFTVEFNDSGVITRGNDYSWVSGNATYASGEWTVNFTSGIFTVAPICQATPFQSGASRDLRYYSTTTSSIKVATYGAGSATQNGFSLQCKRIGVDLKPKTAKVASSIGVPTVPGITTQAIDTFSFSYGTTNATTVCSASPCSFVDEIGTPLASSSKVTRGAAGAYTVNFAKTYTKLKCTGGASTSATASRPIGAINCTASCSSVSFQTLDSNFAQADTFGTLVCQGSY